MQQITKIEIDGKEVGLFFAIASIMKTPDAALKMVGTTDQIIEGVAEVILAGHENYCILKKIAPVVSWEDVFVYVNGAVIKPGGFGKLEQVIKPYVEAIAEMQKAVGELEEQPKKKAGGGKKQSGSHSV
jgi:hypothetical protein